MEDLKKASNLSERTILRIESGEKGYMDTYINYVHALLHYLPPIKAMDLRGHVMEDVLGRF